MSVGGPLRRLWRRVAEAPAPPTTKPAPEPVVHAEPAQLDSRLKAADMLRVVGEHEAALATYASVVDSYEAACAQVDHAYYDWSFPLASRAAAAMVFRADTLVALGRYDEAVAGYELAVTRFRDANAESSSETDDASRDWAAVAQEKLDQLRGHWPE